MGFLDALLGRTKPVRPDLDQLFGLPAAAITLQAAAGFHPTGQGSVCFAAVVILTMLASMSFDPRLLWDGCDPEDDEDD